LEKHELISSPHISVTTFASIFRFPRPILCENANLVVRSMALFSFASRAKRSHSIINLSK
jgi:hypothetical protein